MCLIPSETISTVVIVSVQLSEFHLNVLLDRGK